MYRKKRNNLSSLQREKLLAEIKNIKRVNKWYNSNGLVAILSVLIIGVSLYLTFSTNENDRKEKLEAQEKELNRREQELSLNKIEYQVFLIKNKKDSLNLSMTRITDSMASLKKGIEKLEIFKKELSTINKELKNTNETLVAGNEYSFVKEEIDYILKIGDSLTYKVDDSLYKWVKKNPRYYYKTIADIKNRLLKSKNVEVYCIGLKYLDMLSEDSKWRYKLLDTIHNIIDSSYKSERLIGGIVLSCLSDTIWTKGEQLITLEKLLVSFAKKHKNIFNKNNCIKYGAYIYYYYPNLILLKPQLYWKYVNINLMLFSENYCIDPDYFESLYYLSPQITSALIIKTQYESMKRHIDKPDYIVTPEDKRNWFNEWFLDIARDYQGFDDMRVNMSNYKITNEKSIIKDGKLALEEVLRCEKDDKPLINKWLGEGRKYLEDNPNEIYKIMTNKNTILTEYEEVEIKKRQ